VTLLIEKKRAEFSFEINENLVEYPEVVELATMIKNTVENYRFYKTLGKTEEANQIKAKI